MDHYRICHICPSFNNIIYSQLAEKQISKGHAVRVFYFRAKGTGLPNGDKNYVDGLTPYSNRDRISFFCKESKILNIFFELYENETFDLIHAHTLFAAGYVAYKANQKWGTPYVVAVRGTDINSFFKARFYLRGLGIHILKNASKVFFLAPAHKKELFDKYIPANLKDEIEEKSYIIPNGIDDFWLTNHADQPKNYDGSKTLSLIYYGDINKNKNLEISLETCKILQKEGYKVEFYVIGKILQKKYMNILKNERYVKYVDFLPKEELIKYLKASDIFLMPSKSETFGLSYVEAMSQGVPVLYTKGQGFDQQFDEGTVGFHVSPHDVHDVVSKVHNLLDNYALISQNCINNINRFSWDLIADRYQEIYGEVIR